MTRRRETGEAPAAHARTAGGKPGSHIRPDSGACEPHQLSAEEWWDIYCQRMAEPGPGPIHLGWWFAALLVSLLMLVSMVAGLWSLGHALLAAIA